jgi:sulfide:quinone oxidoreductase
VTRITPIVPQFAVTGALRPEDFAAVAGQGFRSIVSNLPDGEQPAYLSSVAEARLAAAAGLAFRHIPTSKAEVFSERVAGGMAEALAELAGPVLAHCASGQRSVFAWAAAAARRQPADCVLAALRSAGFDLEPVREELEEQRDPSLTGRVPAALDCGCGEAADPA